MHLIWFREDLRLINNPALYYAAKENPAGLAGVYLLDSTMWQRHQMADCRIQFLLRGLKELAQDLQKINVPLIVKEVAGTSDIPEELGKIVQEIKAEKLFFNRQYEVNETKRDQAVLSYLKKRSIHCQIYHDQCILPPGSIKTQEGSHYKVFTAFKRAWYQQLNFLGNHLELLGKPEKQKPLNFRGTTLDPFLQKWGAEADSSFWPAGENQARKRLENFVSNKIYSYDKERDFPSLEGTSRLSPYLSTGMISATECLIAGSTINDEGNLSSSQGAISWINELIWRDFYKHILVAVPRVSMGKAYQQKTEKIKWNYNQDQYEAWTQGRTGFPIIDAAMRQLNETGWMHNRLRMVTAMFFTKNLFFDWRLGEEYFIRHLIDGDLAANNGGWQWCASTGTDAAPYFRIFNPITQSERFDPNGDFIREYCPELTKFTAKSIHHPHIKNPILAREVGYPFPIINLQESRARAIKAFKEI